MVSGHVCKQKWMKPISLIREIAFKCQENCKSHIITNMTQFSTIFILVFISRVLLTLGTMWAVSTSRVKTKLFCCQRDIGSKILVSSEFLSNSWASQRNLVLETKRLKFCTNIDHKCHFATKQVNFLKQNALFFCWLAQFCCNFASPIFNILHFLKNIQRK